MSSSIKYFHDDETIKELAARSIKIPLNPPEAVKKLAVYASARQDRRLVEALAGGVSYGVGNHPF